MTGIWRAWRAMQAARRAQGTLTLLTTPGCGLCREAHVHIEAAFGRGAVTVVDIVGDREMEDRFLLRVPVLLLEETVLAEGEISAHDARVARIRRDALLAERVGRRA